MYYKLIDNVVFQSDNVPSNLSEGQVNYQKQLKRVYYKQQAGKSVRWWEYPCCEDEKRNFNGWCVNCGAPCI